MIWLQVVLLLMVALLLGWLTLLMNRVLNHLEQFGVLLRLLVSTGDCHAPDAMTNYSTWTYREGVWQMVDKRIENGFGTGEPPRRPGSYEGETVRRPAVRHP